MSTYTCKFCGWTGTNPSVSDASTLQRVFVSDESGGGFENRIVRVQIPICPCCFSAVRSDAMATTTSSRTRSVA